jgi:hypothetical protein
LALSHIEEYCEKKHQSRRNAFEVAGQSEQVEAVFDACDHDRPKVRAHSATTAAKRLSAAGI